MNNLIKQHDPLARKFLSDLTVAREFLNTYLTPEIKVKCDFNTLRIESGSYVEDDLKKHCSDIVYRMDLKNKSNCMYVYTLIEHQGKPERLMPLRILRYQIAIIQKHLGEVTTNKKSDKDLVLPLVVPLVFYNGKQSPYPHPCDITELFANKDLYADAQLGKFKLVDLTIMEAVEILQHKKLAALEMVLKHIHARDFITTAINDIAQAIAIGLEDNLTDSLLQGTFSYLFDGREKADIIQLLLKLKQTIPYNKSTEEILMSYADELRQEGEQKAQATMIKEMLKAGAELSFIEKVSHVDKAEIEKIKRSLH